jgi:hypothetical protein
MIVSTARKSEVIMNSSLACQGVEKLDQGVVLKQIDDLCFVHFSDRAVGAARARNVGEKLIDFIEKTGCRKLVMSFAGVESIYGFMLDSPPRAPQLDPEITKSKPTDRAHAGSDLWVG